MSQKQLFPKQNRFPNGSHKLNRRDIMSKRFTLVACLLAVILVGSAAGANWFTGTNSDFNAGRGNWTGEFTMQMAGGQQSPWDSAVYMPVASSGMTLTQPITPGNYVCNYCADGITLYDWTFKDGAGNVTGTFAKRRIYFQFDAVTVPTGTVTAVFHAKVDPASSWYSTFDNFKFDPASPPAPPKPKKRH
jgi:hypothetical protein